MADCSPEVKDNAENTCKSASKSCSKKLVAKAKLSLQKKNRLREKSNLLKDVFDQFSNLNETCEFKDVAFPQFIQSKGTDNDKKQRKTTKQKGGKKLIKKQAPLQVNAKVNEPLIISPDIYEGDTLFNLQSYGKKISDGDNEDGGKKFVKLKHFSYRNNERKEKLSHTDTPDCQTVKDIVPKDEGLLSQTEFGKIDVFLCQICQKDLSHMNSTCKTQHVNKCMDKMEVSERKPQKKESKRHVPAADTGTRKARRAPKKRKDRDDEEIQVAMAMSISTAEEHQRECDELIGNVNKKVQQDSKLRGKKACRRKKESPVKTPLQTFSSEEKISKISERVAALLELGESNDNEIPSTPSLRRSKILESSGRQSTLWGMSACIEDSYSDMAFYVNTLIPPVCISKLKAGMRIKHVHEIPGRDKSIIINSPNTREQDNMVNKNLNHSVSQPSSGDMPLTQTAVVLAQLVTDEVEGKSQKESSEGSNNLVQELSPVTDSVTVKLSSSIEHDNKTIVDGKECEVTEKGLMTTGKILPYVEYKESKSAVLVSLQKDMLTLVNNCEFSDVKISTKDNVNIAAHKLVLSSRCQVLRNQLKTCISVVDMKEYSYEAVIQFLNFLYAGHIELNIFNVQELFKLAKVYQIQELALLCKSFTNSEGLNETFLVPDDDLVPETDNRLNSNDTWDIKDVWGDSCSESGSESPTVERRNSVSSKHSSLDLQDFVTDLLSQETELSHTNKGIAKDDDDNDDELSIIDFAQENGQESCGENVTIDLSMSEEISPACSKITGNKTVESGVKSRYKSSAALEDTAKTITQDRLMYLENVNEKVDCEGIENLKTHSFEGIKNDELISVETLPAGSCEKIENVSHEFHTVLSPVREKGQYGTQVMNGRVHNRNDVGGSSITEEMESMCEKDVDTSVETGECRSMNTSTQEMNDAACVKTAECNDENEEIIILSDEELFENDEMMDECTQLRKQEGSCQSKVDFQIQSDEELFSETDNDIINSMIEDSMLSTLSASRSENDQFETSNRLSSEISHQSKSNASGYECTDFSENNSKNHCDSMNRLPALNGIDVFPSSSAICNEDNSWTDMSKRKVKRKMDSNSSFTETNVSHVTSSDCDKMKNISNCKVVLETLTLPDSKRIRVSSENNLDNICLDPISVATADSMDRIGCGDRDSVNRSNIGELESSTPLIAGRDKTSITLTLKSPGSCDESVHLDKFPQVSLSPCHISQNSCDISDFKRTPVSYGDTSSKPKQNTELRLPDVSSDEDNDVVCIGEILCCSPVFPASQRATKSHCTDVHNSCNSPGNDKAAVPGDVSPMRSSYISHESDKPQMNPCSPNIDDLEMVSPESTRMSSSPSDEIQETEGKVGGENTLGGDFNEDCNNVDVWDDFDDCGYDVVRDTEMVAHDPTQPSVTGHDNVNLTSGSGADQNHSDKGCNTPPYQSSPDTDNPPTHSLHSNSSGSKLPLDGNSACNSKVDSGNCETKLNSDDDVCLIASDDSFVWTDESLNMPDEGISHTPTLDKNVERNVAQSKIIDNETPKIRTDGIKNSKKPWVPPSPFTPMPEYDNMKTPHLKRELQKYGLRPVGKKRMVTALKDLYQQTHQYVTDSEYEDEVMSLKSKQTAQTADKPSDNESVELKAQPKKKTREKAERKKKEKRAKGVVDGVCSSTIEGDKSSHTSNIGSLDKWCSKPLQKNVELKNLKKSSSAKGGTRLGSELTAESSQFTSQTSSSNKNSAMQFSSGDESDAPVVLEETMFITDTVDDGDEIASSQVQTSDLNKKLKEFFTTNPELHSMVLFYEPLPFDWLKAKVKEAGIKCSACRLMEYMDEKCITFTLKSERGRNRKQSKKAKKNASS